MIKGMNCKRLDGDVSYLSSLKDYVWRLGGTHAQEEGYAMTMSQMRKVKGDFMYVVNLNDSKFSQMLTVARLRYLTRTKWIEVGNEDYFIDFDESIPWQNQAQLDAGRESARKYVQKAEEYLSYIRLTGGTMFRKIILVGAYIKEVHNRKRRDFNKGWNEIVSEHCRSNGYAMSYHIYEAHENQLLRFDHLKELVQQDLQLFITECGVISDRAPGPNGVPDDLIVPLTDRTWKGVRDILRPDDYLLVQVSHNDRFPIGLYQNGQPTPLFDIFTEL